MRPARTWKQPENPSVRVFDTWKGGSGGEAVDLAILAGAGISVAAPSNLPTAVVFLRHLYEAALPPSCDRSAFSAAAALRFEAVIDALQSRFDPTLEVLGCFAEGVPNHNHRCLAALAAKGALILTTNFDTLIEKAFDAASPYIARYERRDFEAADGKEAFLDPPEIWHLHGLLNDPLGAGDRRSTIVASIRDCWKSQDMFRLDEAKGRALASALKARHVIVVGYSGADDYDIGPALLSITSDKSMIWIRHTVGKPLSPDPAFTITQLPDETFWFADPSVNALAAMSADGARAPLHVSIVRYDTAEVLGQLAGLSSSAAGEETPTRQIELSVRFERWRDRHLPDTLSRYLLAIRLAEAAGLKSEVDRLVVEASNEMRSHDSVSEQPSTLRAIVELSTMMANRSEMAEAVAILWNAMPAVSAQPAIEANRLTTLGRLRQSSNSLEDAIRLFRESLRVRLDAGLTSDIEVARFDLAKALFIRGFATRDFGEAEEQALLSLRDAMAAAHPEGIARANLLLGRMAEHRGQSVQAQQRYSKALDAACRSANPGLLAEASGEYGIFLWQGVVETLANEPSPVPPAEMVRRIRQASSLLADAVREHYAREEWHELLTVCAQLAECLQALQDNDRSLLADCIAFHSAIRARDLMAMTIAFGRILDGTARLLPSKRFDGSDKQVFVNEVQRELWRRGALI